MVVGWLPGADVEMLTLLGVGMAMPAQFALMWRVFFPQRESSETLESGVRWLLLMLFLFVLVPRSALDLTVSLHPLIYDFYALKFDVAAGLNITPWVIEVIQAVPGFGPLVSVAYGLTPLAFLALVLLQLCGRPAHLPNAILLWVVLTFCALVALPFLSNYRPQIYLRLRRLPGSVKPPRRFLCSWWQVLWLRAMACHPCTLAGCLLLR